MSVVYFLGFVVWLKDPVICVSETAFTLRHFLNLYGKGCCRAPSFKGFRKAYKLQMTLF